MSPICWNAAWILSKAGLRSFGPVLSATLDHPPEIILNQLIGDDLTAAAVFIHLMPWRTGLMGSVGKPDGGVWTILPPHLFDYAYCIPAFIAVSKVFQAGNAKSEPTPSS